MSIDYSAIVGIERAAELEAEAAAKAEQTAETRNERYTREAYDSAASHLERVKTTKDAAGQLRFSYQDRHAAEQDLEEKKKAMWAAQNEGAGYRRLKTLEAGKAAEQKKRDAQAAQEHAARDAALKTRLRSVYQGSDAEFESQFPALKAAYYERQALSQLDTDMAQLLAKYGGRF